MTTNLQWHSGPPPFAGWWNANYARSASAWRWFEDGHWSFSVASCDDKNVVKDRAASIAVAAHPADCIEWSWQWPEHARVPRIDPLTELQANTEAEFVVGRRGIADTLATIAAHQTGKRLAWSEDPLPTGLLAMVDAGLVRTEFKPRLGIGGMHQVFITPAGLAALDFYRAAEKRVRS